MVSLWIVAYLQSYLNIRRETIIPRFLAEKYFFQIKNELQSIELYTTISWTRPINSKHSDSNADLTKYIYILKNSII